MKVHVAQTVMQTVADKLALANETLAFAETITPG